MKLRIFIAIVALAQFSQVGLTVEPTLHWKLVPLAVDANEGIDIADFNGDGKPDVAAGRFWYQNPEFRPRPLRNFKDVNGVSATQRVYTSGNDYIDGHRWRCHPWYASDHDDHSRQWQNRDHDATHSY